MKIIDLRRTHGKDLWNSREIASEENESGEAETTEARTAKVNIDRPFWRTCGA
jgi:hypothetical protein